MTTPAAEIAARPRPAHRGPSAPARPAESDVPEPPAPVKVRRVYCTVRQPETDKFLGCAWLVVREREQP